MLHSHTTKMPSVFSKYEAQGQNDIENSYKVLNEQSGMFLSPYSTGTYHIYSIAHPFGHGLHLLQNIWRIVKGIGLLCYAIGHDFEDNAPKVCDTIAKECASLILNVFNILFSIVSLATRSIMSALLGSYLSSSIDDMDSIVQSNISPTSPVSYLSHGFFRSFSEGVEKSDQLILEHSLNH